jgi:hypothetical protein
MYNYYTIKDTIEYQLQEQDNTFKKSSIEFGTKLRKDEYILIKEPREKLYLPKDNNLEFCIEDNTFGFLKISDCSYVFFEHDSLDIYNPQ